MDSQNFDYKKKNPFERANFISKLFFLWMLPIFYKGYKKDLQEEDLYAPLKSHESSTLGNKLARAWKLEESKRNPALWKAIFSVFKMDFLFSALMFLFIETVTKLSQPMFLSKLLEYYNPNSKVSLQEAYVYGGLIILASFLNVLVTHNYVLFICNLGMKIKIACCSLIYRKALRLSKTALGSTTVGQLVNLLSNDVGRFESALMHFNSLWMTPLEVLIIFYLMYSSLGYSSITGIGYLLLFTPLQMYMGKLTSRYRLRTAIRTDERIRLMNEIVQGVQVIKMYTWEEPFAKLVEITRKIELKQIKVTSILKAIAASFSIFNNLTAIYFCVLVYYLMGNLPDPGYVFVVMSFFNIMKQSITKHFPRAITGFAEGSISLKRIQNFFQYSELQSNHFEDNKEVKIELKKVSAKWTEEYCLKDIDFDAGRELVAVVGSVGSGKSSLLNVILKELEVTSGSLKVLGRISYAAQEPWLFPGTVRDNILFGSEFREERYFEVIRVCALETDLVLFPHGDSTVVGERGTMLSGGQRARINLARAVYKEADIYLLDDPLSAVDAHVGKLIFDECISAFLKEKCVVLVTHQIQYLRNVPKILCLKNGERTEFEGFGTELSTEIPDKKPILNQNITSKSKGEEVKEQKSVGGISGKVYKRYFQSGGSNLKIFWVLALFVLTQISATAADYFVTFWVNLEQLRPETESFFTRTFTSNICLFIYTIIIISVITLTLTRSITFYKFCLRASQILHNNMFEHILLAPMRFFNTNPSGRILNRFAKDMGTVDEGLPVTIIDTLQIGLDVFSISIVVGSVSPSTLIPTIIMLLLFYYYRIIYLATSRSVKRLEGVTRSPVFTLLSTSLQGLSTIRAFGVQNHLEERFDDLQNINSSAFHLFLCSSRAFGFWLGFHCVVYVSFVILSILFIKQETLGGNVGLAITQALRLTQVFQFGMRQWSELENNMTAVERISEYIDIKKEIANGEKTPPKIWPEDGKIEFESLSMKYSETDPYVLKNLSFVIEPREKVGIVGRTGAGKSSIISALFRLAETEGKIFLDGVNTSLVPLKSLRSKISIIPQEPVLFSGSLRKNLDPFEEFSDLVLWNALEEVELKAAVSDLPHGLESKMSEGGSNFSVGQRQLVCLARAIIRSNKILVLDEATANVDPQTDSLIQKTIRNKFAECTVLTIAHRLHTIIDSDKVLVMDAGQVVEFGHPFELLEKKGEFYNLVQQTGSTTSQYLKDLAKANYLHCK